MAHFRPMLKRWVGWFLLTVTVGLSFSACARSCDTPVYMVYTAVFETDAALADMFAVGDLMTDARTKGEAGKILAIKKENALREDGYGVYALNDRVTLAITLGRDAVRTSQGICRDGFLPCAGDTVYLYGRACLEGQCVRVRVL